MTERQLRNNPDGVQPVRGPSSSLGGQAPADPARLQHILLVDDDPEIRVLVEDVLISAGFSVSSARDGGEMRACIQSESFDLVLLDLSLPGEDGLSLCRGLRSDDVLPVIILTARSDPLDCVMGLEFGADDYIVKPFHSRELLARVRTVLRRMNRSEEALAKRVNQAAFCGWILDFEHRHLVDPGGTVVMLSGAEYNLLKALVDRPQVVLSREQLLAVCNTRDLSGRAIDLQVARVPAEIAG